MWDYIPNILLESTISERFNDPAVKSIEIIIKPIDTSYEIICAADRRLPKKAYLELLDQPATTIPYTPRDDTAKIYIIPTFISDKTTF